jgi:hypothetical protein
MSSFGDRSVTWRGAFVGGGYSLVGRIARGDLSMSGASPFETFFPVTFLDDVAIMP